MILERPHAFLKEHITITYHLVMMKPRSGPGLSRYTRFHETKMGDIIGRYYLNL